MFPIQAKTSRPTKKLERFNPNKMKISRLRFDRLKAYTLSSPHSNRRRRRFHILSDVTRFPIIASHKAFGRGGGGLLTLIMKEQRTRTCWTKSDATQNSIYIITLLLQLFSKISKD